MDAPKFKGFFLAPLIGAIVAAIAIFALGFFLSGPIKGLFADKPQPVYQSTKYAEYLEAKWGLDCGRPTKDDCNLQPLNMAMTGTETDRTLYCTMITIAFLRAREGMTSAQDQEMVNELKKFEAQIDAQ